MTWDIFWTALRILFVVFFFLVNIVAYLRWKKEEKEKEEYKKIEEEYVKFIGDRIKGVESVMIKDLEKNIKSSRECCKDGGCSDEDV